MGFWSNVVGGIIGAGGSAIGARQQNKAMERANERNIEAAERTNRNRIQWAADDAQKAGFNRLAALGNVQSVTPSIQPESGSAVGEGLRTLSSAVSSASAARDAQRLTDAQIRRLDSETLLNTARSRTNIAVASRVGRGGTDAQGRGKNAAFDIMNTFNSNSNVYETAAKNYGMLTGEVLGLGSAASDLASSAHSGLFNWSDKWKRAYPKGATWYGRRKDM